MQTRDEGCSHSGSSLGASGWVTRPSATLPPSGFDPLLTIEVLRRPSEAQRSGFGLFARVGVSGHLRWAAVGCVRSAPQLLHATGIIGWLHRQQKIASLEISRGWWRNPSGEKTLAQGPPSRSSQTPTTSSPASKTTTRHSTALGPPGVPTGHGRSPNSPRALTIHQLTPELRGERLREVASDVLWRNFKEGDVVHYRQWLDLVLGEGHRVGGKNTAATFLTQVARIPAVKRVGRRSGLYEVVASAA
jgi:hypothetical protein